MCKIKENCSNSGICPHCSESEILVYTDLGGETVSVANIEDQKIRFAVMAGVMLNDIERASEIESGMLAMITEVSDNTYAKAFEYAVKKAGVISVRRNDNDFFVATSPDSIDMPAIIESMHNRANALKEMCKRMEDNGIYPSSKAYQDVLHTKYYIDVWRKQLCALTCVSE